MTSYEAASLPLLEAFFSLEEPVVNLCSLQDDEDWFKLNAGQYGLFRVNYPKFVWDRLANAAQSPPADNQPPPIPAEDLAGLLDDSWALAQAAETPIDNFLALSRYCFDVRLRLW